MEAYADRVILEMQVSEQKGIAVNDTLLKGKIVSLGHVPISTLGLDSKEDPLKVGDTIVLAPNSQGVDIEVDGKDYTVFRRMQILYIV